jgi:hypothetical protein
LHPVAPTGAAAQFAYEPDVPPPLIVLLTCENAVLMLLVSIGIDAARATAIKPTSTAYSTAVGPSSLVKKFRTLVIIVFIANSFSMKLGYVGQTRREHCPHSVRTTWCVRAHRSHPARTVAALAVSPSSMQT